MRRTEAIAASASWCACLAATSPSAPVMAIRRLVTPGPGDEWGPLPPHASVMPRRRGWRWLERALLILGFVLIGYYGYVTVEARLYQAYENRELDAILASAPEAP